MMEDIIDFIFGGCKTENLRYFFFMLMYLWCDVDGVL